MTTGPRVLTGCGKRNSVYESVLLESSGASVPIAAAFERGTPLPDMFSASVPPDVQLVSYTNVSSVTSQR